MNLQISHRIKWNFSNQPFDTTFDRLLYDIRRSDHGENLLLDSVTIAEILEQAEEILALDALLSPYNKLQRKMEILEAVMNRIHGDVTVQSMQISQPFKQYGVAQVAVIFELSDGQTVTIFFHNPDVNPKKITPTDELISWKWLLNKKDITIVVAPERGQDLNVRDVAMRIIKLAARNSAAFARANAKRAEKMQTIESLKTEITGLEKELSDKQHDLEVVKMDYETWLGNGKPKQNNQIAFNPVSPQGYAKAMADPALKEKYADTLNNFFQWRIREVKRILRENPKFDQGDSGNLFYNLIGYKPLSLSLKIVESNGRTIGATWQLFGEYLVNSELPLLWQGKDDLTKTPEQLASEIEAEAYVQAQKEEDIQHQIQIRFIAVKKELIKLGWITASDGVSLVHPQKKRAVIYQPKELSGTWRLYRQTRKTWKSVGDLIDRNWDKYADTPAQFARRIDKAGGAL